MAEQLSNSPTTHEMTDHVRDYGRFVGMMKWGAIICFVLGLTWVAIVKAYW